MLIILCLYFILALFDSSLVGDGGREWGRYLRTAWGGAAIVPLLFWLYLCVAKLLKFRVPRLPRQILGTVQLYISFAFMLGFLREIGWISEWTLFRPGDFGEGLAKFFVLNVGTFITLILVAGSFILSAFFFGSRILKLSVPQIPTLKFNTHPRNSRRVRRKREHINIYTHDQPENILFKPDIPSPKLKPAPEDFYDYDDNSREEFEPSFTNTPTMPEPEAVITEQEPLKNAIDIFDKLISSIEAGELAAPGKRRRRATRRKKIRRPLPDLSIPENGSNNTPEDSGHDEPVFPPPMEIFGANVKTISDKNIFRTSENQGKVIISTLKNFGVNASVANIINGPSVTQFQLELAPGTKVSKISGLDDDLAMSLAVRFVRIEAPILGTHFAGVEVPNNYRKTIALRNILESREFQDSTARIPLALGVQTDGKILVHGLEEMPHILIAGNKGSGKTVFMNCCILGMCSRQRPENLRLILIDTRHVEFALYDGLPHLLAAPVSDNDNALKALKWALDEMTKRTGNFAKARVRNLAAYNRKLPKNDRLPEIVIVIDDLADLIYSSGSEAENLIIRLAQKAGASGIYMMLSTQRPSVDVITSQIKANIPVRAALSLSSQAESRNILDVTDADRLTGKGDMLFKDGDNAQILRLQAPYISEEKISEFVDYMNGNLGTPDTVKFS